MKHMLKPVCIKVGLTLFAGACLCGGIQAHSLMTTSKNRLPYMNMITVMTFRPEYT